MFLLRDGMIGLLCLDDAFGNLRIPPVFNEEKIQEQILQGTCVSKCKENLKVLLS